MVEVDPAILIAGSTAIAALVGVVVCMSSNNNKERVKEVPVAPKKETKTAPKAKKAKEKKAEKKEEKKVEKKEPAPAPKKKAAAKVVERAPSPPKPTPVVAQEEPKTKKAKETPEQRAARLERQKLAKQKKAEEAAAALAAQKNPAPVATKTVDNQYATSTQQAPISDGWAVVENRAKKKPKPVEVKATPTEDEASSQPVSTNVTEIVMVDSKKIGGIIGPKGATLHAIQDMTEVTINTPKDRDGSAQAPVSVVGSSEGVFAAVKIIKELNTKGYSKALEGDNFNESAITVKYSYLSELIGKNGSCIRAMQDKTGVKIAIPPNNSDAKTKVRIGLAGTPEGIVEVKSIINDIMTYFHSDVTHPGVIHQAISVPERMFNMIIGSKGAEIKHIQNNFKVNVHIPNADSTIKDVLVVGQPSGVSGAVKYIEKIVSNLNEEEAKAMSVAETWNEQQDQSNTDGDGDEPWMSQYSYNKDQKHSLISKEGADLLQKAQASAWKESTSADGW